MKSELLNRIIHKAQFRLSSILGSTLRRARRIGWQARGMSLGKGTLPGKISANWPHQISIGSGCALEEELVFKFDGIFAPGPSIVIGNNVFLGRQCEFNIQKGITIADDCLIASGCKFIDHDHSMDAGRPIGITPGAEAEIKLGPNVWLGVNVVVLKGVEIGEGAVVGAGAVVTRSIPPFEIWAGVPARKTGTRQGGA